jgi:hypothetical protein
MTQEAKTSKNFFRLNGGLNTEINELNFPDGFTTDEANYELLVDGSRRRRKGLAAESGAGTALTVSTFSDGDKCQAYIWRNVGGDPDKKVVVFRHKSVLYFADADETVSDGWASGTGSIVGLVDFLSTGGTSANSYKTSVSFSQGRGYLFVTGPYIESFYVSYDASTGYYSAANIGLRIRDFADLEDGISIAQEPTGTITEDHRYNLRNRGWKQDDMDTYLSDKTKHPSKNALWYKGYKRTYGTSIAETDGQRSWDSSKLENEAFGSSSAPRGSLFIEPYDSTFGYGVGGAGGELVNITTWSYTGSPWTITITTDAAHGIGVGDEFTIEGNQMEYDKEVKPGVIITITDDFNGTWTAITGTTGSTLKFVWSRSPSSIDSWVDQYKNLGTADGSLSITRSAGTAHTDGFNAIEFHAGRIFYAGMKNQEFADTIVFSQVADSTEKFGRCYQEADPTDENFNALVPTDGGTIIIPGMGGVLNLVSVRNSLIVLAREGVWEISGGQRGVFTSDGYSVRKLSSASSNAPDGWAKIDDTLVYSGPAGIMLVTPNEYTGQLEVQNATEQTVQTLWNQVPDAEQENCSMAYDDSLRRLYVMWGSDAGVTGIGIDTMLIYDARASAWFKYTFDTPTSNVLLCGFSIPNADDSSDNKKMKFIYQASTTTVQVADFDQTTFDDWDGTNGPLPYLVFGHDGLGDWQRRRQAPIITVYSKRTETGYTSTGNGFDPVNESSTLMSAYWDWTNDPISGKGGATYPDTTAKSSGQFEVYRHVRNFVPSGTTDVDGYPVVVTRNKVRGRGRSLQLRFDGATDKDSHILGFTTNYKVTRKI